MVFGTVMTVVAIIYVSLRDLLACCPAVLLYLSLLPHLAPPLPPLHHNHNHNHNPHQAVFFLALFLGSLSTLSTLEKGYMGILTSDLRMVSELQ
jgi:hypothetical protein